MTVEREPSPVSGVTVGAGQLFHEHARFVARFLQRIGGSPRDLDDLTQEVFLVAHRRGGYVEGRARPRTWLAEIAVRVLSTHRRSLRRKPEQPLGDAARALRSDLPPPDEQASARQSIARLKECLASLGAEHRVVFVLSELEGEPSQAIARALDVPLGTIYSRLHHARRRVTAALRAAEGPGARLDPASR